MKILKTLTVICPLLLNCLLVTNANAITSYQMTGTFSGPGHASAYNADPVSVEREAFDFPVSFALNLDIDESSEGFNISDTYALFNGRDLVSNISLTIDGVIYSDLFPRFSSFDIRQSFTNDSSLWVADLNELKFSENLPSPVVRVKGGTVDEQLINGWLYPQVQIKLTDLDGDIYAETVSDLITLDDSEFETKELSIFWQSHGYHLTSYGITGNIDTIMTVVPLPTTVWLFGSGLVGMIGLGRRQRR